MPEPADSVEARKLIELLGLERHPEEGGFFRETYRSAAAFEPGGQYRGTRPLATAIFYLLTPETCSALHRLPGDEVFHFYLGDPVEMLMLSPDGEAERVLLGPEVGMMRLQHVVPGGTWQGSRLVAGGSWALLGTTMAPGFDASDYEPGTAQLLETYPEESQLILSLLAKPAAD